MDDPVPIEGIIEGEPESLAVVCAAGGSAIVAYCSAVGADAHVADVVVAALATFRRGVVENADQEPAQLEALLLTSTAHAARRVASVDPSPVQQAAAQVALASAVTGPLTPGLAPRIIRALVEAAPITALGGDPAAVRRATEQHYIRMFDRHPAVAPAAAAPSAPPPSPNPAPPPLSPGPPPGPQPASAEPRASTGEGAWIPPELAGLDADEANARAVTAPVQWSTGPAPPAEAPEQPLPPPQPPAPAPAAAEHAPVQPPHDGPTVPPPPGALVIKRGGHWPLRRRPRASKPRAAARHGGAPRGRNLLVGGIAGLALGAGIAALAVPEDEGPQSTILVRPLDTPFTVDGAVFNVARTRQALWALEIRRQPPRPGRSWVTLAAQTRNIDREDFLPRALGFRLRTATGIVIGPETAQVPSDVRAARGRQGIGKRSSVHLGFQVPSAQRGLTLEFDPGPRSPRIRVPLD